MLATTSGTGVRGTTPGAGAGRGIAGADRGIARADLHRLVFHGHGGSLLGIHVVNVFLTLVTLGVFLFWARVRVRRYLFAQTAFEGDRFAFHGLGAEMLVGFVKAVLVFGVPIALLNWLPVLLSAGTAATVAASLGAWALALVCVPVARAGARRYRLSRTSWRGIRFSFRGSTAEFVRLFVAGSLASLFTLGLYYPFFATRTQGFLTRHSYFGTAKLDFDGDGRDLLVDFVYAVLLTLPTLGVCWFWFVAAKRRYFWRRTAFRGARFICTITGWNLLRLRLGNAGLMMLTLGLGWPFATVRNARYVCRHVALGGALDLDTVRQDARRATATGEGLLGLLEADLNLG
ncbi:MAG: YjgN family protein [Candidatus Rokuibacteriota bacterium]